jgi:hypothetical protein
MKNIFGQMAKYINRIALAFFCSIGGILLGALISFRQFVSYNYIDVFGQLLVLCLPILTLALFLSGENFFTFTFLKKLNQFYSDKKGIAIVTAASLLFLLIPSGKSGYDDILFFIIVIIIYSQSMLLYCYALKKWGN